ncbi:MAG: AAA family ATPase [Bacteroidota bacterium]
MSAPLQIRVGTDDFAKLLLESSVFVDKSLLIKEFIEDSGDVVLITRPRRWGKSLNMDMIKRFLALEVDEQGQALPRAECLNYKLFAGGEATLFTGEKKQLNALKIAQHRLLMERYQGQFPVIKIGLKDAQGSTYEEVLTRLRQVLFSLFNHHRYLLTSQRITANEQAIFKRYLREAASAEDLTRSLGFLSELLYKHFGKPVYILVDEYDAPINHVFLTLKNDQPALDNVLKLFRRLFSATFKTNPYLAKGLITGILRIAKANLFSDLNNVREYTLLDKRFAASYGFTQAEVDKLLEKAPVSTSSAQIQRWYNGYTLGNEVIYNPWSMMCCLGNEGELGPYWIDSGGTHLVDALLLDDKNQQDLQTLVKGGRLERTVDRYIVFGQLDDPSKLYSLLLFSGYLNPTAVDATANIYQLSIPNDEIQTIYEKRILQWADSKVRIDSAGYLNLARLLAAGQYKAFEETLQAFLQQATSFFQTGDKMAEVFYSGFMLCLLSMLAVRYIIDSERESGQGRPDAMLIPKPGRGNRALIIEYKVGKSQEDPATVAQQGLAQIEKQGYVAKVQDHAHVQHLEGVCIVFRGKEVVVGHRAIALYS